MFRLFNPESKFMKAMSTLADLVLLNIYFLLTCVPVVTIGAAHSALYTVCFRIGTPKEEGITRSYFRAFRDNFKQSTLLWLIILLFAGTSALNTYLFGMLNAPMRYMSYLFLVLFALALLILCYGFPLISLFDNDTKTTLKNALLFSIAYLPRSLLIAALNFLPWILLLTNLYIFFTCALFWTFFYFSTIAYFNTFQFKKIFAPYLEEIEEPEENESEE